MTDRERLLDELRPVAFAIAYRMLGSVAEAEDVVQEALLRVHQALTPARDRVGVRRHRDHSAGNQRSAKQVSRQQKDACREWRGRLLGATVPCAVGHPSSSMTRPARMLSYGDKALSELGA